ncbi:hypothetical protein UFOVP4_60, partial [uncultured Caudovirales phage]
GAGEEIRTLDPNLGNGVFVGCKSTTYNDF